MTLTILLIDLPPLTALGITAGLSRYTELVVEQAGPEEATVRLAGSDEIRLAIVDPYRPTLTDGLALCRRIKNVHTPPRVLALSNPTNSQDLIFFLLAGIDSFVWAHEHPERLALAVESTLAGRREWLLGPHGKDSFLAAGGPSTLTGREREVLWMVRERWTNRQIGSSLSISPNTVKNHVAAILRKLGVKRRSEIFVGSSF